jgi:hypothetical protein
MAGDRRPLDGGIPRGVGLAQVLGLTPDPYRYLTRNERVILEVRRHFAALLPDSFVTMMAVVLVALLGMVTSPGDDASLLDTFLGLLAVAFVIRLMWKMWQWWIDRIVVTDQRIFEVSGVLTRSVASMPLARVTDMTYRRSLAGRILGYGDLVVESAGQEQALSRIDRLPRPDDFYRTITSLVGSSLPSLPNEPRGTDDPDDTGPLPRVTI